MNAAEWRSRAEVRRTIIRKRAELRRAREQAAAGQSDPREADWIAGQLRDLQAPRG